MADRRNRKLIYRTLLAAGAALGITGLSLIPAKSRSQNAAVEGARGQRESQTAKLKFSRHAEQRLRERRISREAVERLVAAGEPFRYRHEGKLKHGYYDRRTGLFVATEGGVVLTVIANATPRYVDKLKRGRGP